MVCVVQSAAFMTNSTYLDNKEQKRAFNKSIISNRKAKKQATIVDDIDTRSSYIDANGALKARKSSKFCSATTKTSRVPHPTQPSRVGAGKTWLSNAHNVNVEMAKLGLTRSVSGGTLRLNIVYRLGGDESDDTTHRLSRDGN